MIDADPRAQSYADAGLWGRVTLDALFKRNLARSPDRLALVDTADRATWNAGSPQRLTYRQADAAVTTIAARFQELGLKPGAIVGIELPNTVEVALTLLACQRAGLIPALMPLLWRTREIAMALEPLTPKALVTTTRAGDDAPADLLRYAAAELFSIRFVLAFGGNTPDGVMSIEDCLSPSPQREARPVTPAANPGDQPALITFRTTPAGHAAVLRSHNHCISSGLATVLEAHLEPGEVIAGAMLPASFASFATTIMPWLLTGGTLVLHQPFTPPVFVEALGGEQVSRAIVPGPLLGEIVPHLVPVIGASLKTLIALYTDARRAAHRTALPSPIDIVDVIALDEWGLVALRRQGGEPKSLPSGQIRQPTDGANGPALLETRLMPSGRLMLRGPMVPYDANAEDGFRATGITAGEIGGLLEIKDRADSVAFVGGLGVGTEEIEKLLLESEELDAVRVVAVSDPLFGERIEARVAPRVTAPVGNDGVIERIHARFDSAGVAPHKVPSRIVVDHMVRADPAAKLRTAGMR